MIRYALVGPDDVIDRIMSDASIDPKVQTKPGWRWLKYTEEAAMEEPFGDIVSKDSVVRKFDGRQIVTVPSEISPVQGRIMLRRAGLREQVEAAIKGAGGDIQDWYEYSLAWHRDNPNLLMLAAALHLSSDNLDNLFITAAEI